MFSSVCEWLWPSFELNTIKIAESTNVSVEHNVCKLDLQDEEQSKLEEETLHCDFLPNNMCGKDGEWCLVHKELLSKVKDPYAYNVIVQRVQQMIDAKRRNTTIAKQKACFVDLFEYLVEQQEFVHKNKHFRQAVQQKMREMHYNRPFTKRINCENYFNCLFNDVEI